MDIIDQHNLRMHINITRIKYNARICKHDNELRHVYDYVIQRHRYW